LWTHSSRRWPLGFSDRGHHRATLPSWYHIPVAIFALVPAALSYHFVERPFRNRVWLPRRAQVFGASASLAALLVAVSLGIDRGKGLPTSLPTHAQVALDLNPKISDPLLLSCLSIKKPSAPCELGDTGRPRFDFAVWGDSHAAADRVVFDRLASELGLHGGAACAPRLRRGHEHRLSATQPAMRRIWSR
jgi:hypothetical protein